MSSGRGIFSTCVEVDNYDIYVFTHLVSTYSDECSLEEDTELC